MPKKRDLKPSGSADTRPCRPMSRLVVGQFEFDHITVEMGLLFKLTRDGGDASRHEWERSALVNVFSSGEYARLPHSFAHDRANLRESYHNE